MITHGSAAPRRLGNRVNRAFAAMHGTTPEDWVGSTATSWGSDTEGLSRLEDGTLEISFERDEH
mgnify:CR=1 FL=1